MPYTIRRSIQARQDIRDFFRYLRREAGETIAQKYRESLEYDIHTLIAGSPYAFTWFHETGAPFRAKLFKLARTTYWIVYVIDEESQSVELVRFWNTSREPDAHGL